VPGRIDAQRLADWLPASRDVEAYFCGPKPFMATVLQSLRVIGVPQTQTHYEFFGPSQALQ
jgi:nitric oxide dioxygenase